MQHTTNYQLNQWEAGDVVRRADFNADNAAIDAALKTIADASGAPYVTGTYCGTGQYGQSNPIKLTLGFRPKAVLITGGSTLSMSFVVFISPVVDCWQVNGRSRITWLNDGVQWYSGNSWLFDSYASPPLRFRTQRRACCTVCVTGEAPAEKAGAFGVCGVSRRLAAQLATFFTKRAIMAATCARVALPVG